MKYKITIYLFLMKMKFAILTLFLLTLFIQIINLIEVSRILENDQIDLFAILYLSLLKLPTTISQIIPFVIIISTEYVVDQSRFSSSMGD